MCVFLSASSYFVYHRIISLTQSVGAMSCQWPNFEQASFFVFVSDFMIYCSPLPARCVCVFLPSRYVAVSVLPDMYVLPLGDPTVSFLPDMAVSDCMKYCSQRPVRYGCFAFSCNRDILHHFLTFNLTYIHSPKTQQENRSADINIPSSHFEHQAVDTHDKVTVLTGCISRMRFKGVITHIMQMSKVIWRKEENNEHT